jgi:hypothetical protein
MGQSLAVLRLWVEVEGGQEPSPGMTTDDDGIGGGLGYWPAWHQETIRSTNGRGKSIGRPVVAVSPLWLTVRGNVASSTQKRSYPIGSLMWLCPLSVAQKNLLKQNLAPSINK